MFLCQTRKIVVLATTGLLTINAHAFHPLVTDDTGTQGSAGNQLEFVIDGTKLRSDGISTNSSSASVVYTRGITDNLDLHFALAYLNKPVSGMQNTALGGKWRFWENTEQGRSLALSAEVRLPVSRSEEEAGLGNGKISGSMSGIFSTATGFGEVHVNIAIDRNNLAIPTPVRSTLYRISVAPVWQINEIWKAGFDTGIETNPDLSAPAQRAYGLLAAIYSPDKNLDFSLAVRRNFHNGTVSANAATLGLTWRF